MVSALGKMASLGVDKLELLVAPRIDKVAGHERKTRVRQVRNSSAETVKQVSLQDAGKGVLLEGRHG